MASESKKRKTPKFPVKGKDKFLSNRRSSKGAGGFNSSKRQDVKNSTKKESEKEIADMKNEVLKCSEFISEDLHEVQGSIEGLLDELSISELAPQDFRNKINEMVETINHLLTMNATWFRNFQYLMNKK